MTPTIREATEGDLDAVVAIFLACWRGPYAAVLPASTLDRLDDAGAEELWRQAFARNEGGILVAGIDGAVVGVARWRLAAGEGRGRLESLYVDPERQGGGVGGALLAAAEDRMRTAGARTASLSVFTANTPSRAFYRSRGWREAEGERVDPRFGEPELRMTKDLTGEDPT